MTKALLFLLTVLPTFLFGQETQMVTTDLENNWYKEVYYVLKSDKSIRQGSYQKLDKKDAVYIKGFYKNGLKDSIWTEFYFGWKYKKSAGKYSADKRVGVWEFYDSNGELEQKYDYTKKEIVYFKPDSKETKVIKGRDTIKAKLDRPPLYNGGSEAMIENLNIKYPLQALNKNISGFVYITFTVDSNGKTSSHRVSKGIGFGCDEEALKGVKAVTDNWSPGILNGRPVSVETNWPVKFTIR